MHPLPVLSRRQLSSRWADHDQLAWEDDLARQVDGTGEKVRCQLEDQMSPDSGRLRSSAIGWAETPRTRAGARLTNAFSKKVENHTAAVA